MIGGARKALIKLKIMSTEGARTDMVVEGHAPLRNFEI